MSEPLAPEPVPAAASPAPYANPGVAALRSEVRTLRALVVVSVVLVVLVGAGLAIGLVASRAQVADLSAQVAALAARPAQTAASPEAAEVKQLGAAPQLASGVVGPSGADPAGAILIGDPGAANVVEVYIDYQCPFCQRWEATIGASLIRKALQPGSDLLVKQYNLAFLGEANAALEPAGASARAASAAACVLDADGVEVFVKFSSAVFRAADPNEPPGQFTAPVLSDLARGAGATAPAIACIEAEQHLPFVAATTQAGFGRGVGGTPTVLVNGTTIGNAFTDPAVLSLVGDSA